MVFQRFISDRVGRKRNDIVSQEIGEGKTIITSIKKKNKIYRVFTIRHNGFITNILEEKITGEDPDDLTSATFNI